MVSCLCFLRLEASLAEDLHAKVVHVVESSEEIPGFDAEQLALVKDKMLQVLQQCSVDGVYKYKGKDEDVRPVLVALQGIIEHVFSVEIGERTNKLIGIIHTPAPATPLCTKGEISQGLVDGVIANDPARLLTVQGRVTTLRDLLAQGGLLMVVYPESGREKRTQEQLQVYQEELDKYSQNLFDLPLPISSMPQELIGATYVFSKSNGEEMVFSIQITQANSPLEDGEFGLWFGSAQKRKVEERLVSVLHYLEQGSLQQRLKTLQ